MHACMHTCITLHYITLHCIALHYITLHCIALHYITLHYLTYIILFILIYNYMHIYIYKQLVSELVGLISPCFPLNPLNPFPDSTPARWPTPRSGRVVSGRCRRSGPVRCILVGDDSEKLALVQWGERDFIGDRMRWVEFSGVWADFFIFFWHFWGAQFWHPYRQNWMGEFTGTPVK